jgi:hypothetical protein
MKYSEARELVEDGDIVSVLKPKNKFSLFADVISIFTQSPIYHTCIVTWMYSCSGQRRLFAVEADSNKRRLIPLSIYEGQEMHVWAKPDNVKYDIFAEDLLARVGSADYGFTKAVKAGLSKYVVLPFSKQITSGEICSELAIKMWIKGGFNFTGETLITPAELEQKMIELNVKRRVIILP